jgi:hypothetical protein
MKETTSIIKTGPFAGATLIEIDPGNTVLCDLCNANYTDRSDSGGFMFQSKAVCPSCAVEFEASVKGYGEESMIGARCPAGVAFADWVRDSCR